MIVSGAELLIIVLYVSLATVVGQQEFTQLSSSQVLYLPSKTTYARAASRCSSYGADLVEIWSEEEWKEVIVELLIHLYCLSHRLESLDSVCLLSKPATVAGFKSKHTESRLSSRWDA